MYAATAGVQGLGSTGAGVRVQSAKSVGPLNTLQTVVKGPCRCPDGITVLDEGKIFGSEEV